MDIYQLVDHICSGYVPNINEIEQLLNSCEPETSYIFNAAHNIALKYCSNKIHIRGIIEFSNYCRCSCAYCGLNAENQELKRYRMDPQEIIHVAREAWDAGYRTIVLQSGEDLWYTREKISFIIKGIKTIGDIAVTLSVGERDYEDYRQWKQDGADRFLLKHETINRKLYNRLHPHSALENRILCLWELKELKYQTGSGFMIGLPDQTPKDIAEDILFLKKLDVDMAGIGPFIPHKGTTLRDNPAGRDAMSLKALAVTRLILKTVHLPATTALLTLDGEGARKAFTVGANVIMLKLESYKYRRLYEIYPKEFGEENNIKQERLKIEQFIESMGKEVAKNRGDSLKGKERLWQNE
ncbi:MAG TPA: [FeFe] hydrogenase H-cluster radical SAM maturase HydE [Thermoanaerobacterales bacterium]|nr:[FeFe] hydrogenase H-cluster radical SAM maturase HydE [Thermoanaerobacterales bacterium]